MADNIDKELNGLELKTDSLPSDWLITLVNPKEWGTGSEYDGGKVY